jgi:hypothetical protein
MCTRRPAGYVERMTQQDPGNPNQADPQVREEVAVDRVEETLIDDFADDHSADEVEQVVDEAKGRYADAPIRDFVPNLVERDARDQLGR